MTPIDQKTIWDRLKTVDQCVFSGKTPERLRQLEKHTGLPWEKIIERMAMDGYAWNDVAEIIGVERRALIQYTRTVGLRFPWLGVRSPIARAHHSRMMQGKNRICARNLKQYNAFGVTDSLPNLVRRFAPPKVSYDCVLMRINRRWDLERALVTPSRPRSQNIAPYNPNAAKNWTHAHDTAAAHA